MTCSASVHGQAYCVVGALPGPVFANSYSRFAGNVPATELYGRAVAAYQATLRTPSAFDRFLGGDTGALDARQAAGLRRFMDTGCSACHSGPLLGGLFNGKQNMYQTWYWNRYNVELTDNNPRLFDNDGNVTTSPVAQGATWGYCCMRYQTPSLTSVAPYGAVTWDMGPLTIDASVRYDKLRLTGYWINGNADNTAYDPATRTVMHNSTDATSYSVGGNYAFSKDLAAFARFSHPPLTTVRIPRDELGRVAFESLERMIHNKRRTGVEREVAAQLVIRQSTGAARKI